MCYNAFRTKDKCPSRRFFDGLGTQQSVRITHIKKEACQ